MSLKSDRIQDLPLLNQNPSLTKSSAQPLSPVENCVLAQHYGFTAEELGFIINYDIKLFLAVPDIAYKTFFQKEFPRMVIQQYELELFVYDIENEVIVSWQV